MLRSYNVLPQGLKSPLMRITYGLQDPDSLLEHIAPGFQGLDLIFEAFRCIDVCAFSEKRIPSTKCQTGPPGNVRGSTS